MFKTFSIFLLLPLAVLLSLPTFAAAQTWVLVDTEALSLEVFAGKSSLFRIEGISIGRGGATRNKIKGDHKTPLGTYRVAWFNSHSRFHRFLGLDYPKREQVERAFHRGDIDAREHERLLAALFTAKAPPQDSPLGGYIGIHGLGRGSPELHEIANWTEGCVALTNEQIERLQRYVRVGTPVVIK